MWSRSILLFIYCPIFFQEELGNTVSRLLPAEGTSKNQCPVSLCSPDAIGLGHGLDSRDFKSPQEILKFKEGVKLGKVELQVSMCGFEQQSSLPNCRLG